MNVLLQPGFYSFPFSFQLPTWVPSSFLFTEGEIVRCKIQYTLRARVEDNSLNRSALLPPIFGKRRFIVANYNCQQFFNMTLETSQIIKNLGIMNEGSANVRATFDKNFYNQGEAAVIKLFIDNSLCKKAIKSITVVLMRQVEYEKKPTVIKKFRHFMNEEVLSGVAANSQEERTVQMVINEGKFKEKKIVREHRKVPLEAEDVILQNYMTPSVNTNLIKCFYYLEIITDHGGLATNDLPKIIFPIFVFPQEIAEDLQQY